jgi:hypothetical protein
MNQRLEALLNYGDILARYQRMRKVSLELNKALPRYVPREGLEATARRLGFWQKGTLVFDSMDQSCVLFDQAIHGYFKDGRNAVDRYLADHPPTPGSDQEAVLAAKQRSFYSLFQVEGIVPDVGVHVHDMLRDRRQFLADVGFSQTAVKGLVLATRVLPFEDFIMTAGAALPTDADTLTKISRLPALNKPPSDIESMSRQEMADVAATVIGLCLKGDHSQDIYYEGIEDDSEDDKVPPAGEAIRLPETQRVGRNDPCPCGSGKKYKKCCGR